MNMWFTKLIKQFFFWIDKIVYNFISAIYDLLITIARTSVLTQADIAGMAERIYKFLAVFMIFKVTLSLITYVVNPDDFSDKSKGISKLGTNIIISLALLILTPYIFNLAYQLQTIILEDNSLATLIFGTSTDSSSSTSTDSDLQNSETFFYEAGDYMAYITMSAFVTPNTSLDGLHECSVVVDPNTEKFNSACSGLTDDFQDNGSEKSLFTYTSDNPNFSLQTLKNYVAAVNAGNLGLLFRQDLVLATDSENENFIFDYKFIFSTVVGVVIILLLLNFCMDVAVRSLKLAFLQLIAPIPILSYVDPKSGKDGMFKKWYELCFKTFLSLFIRLLALYFAVYMISKIAEMKMVDLVDGSYQTNCFVAIFMIIGALMFAKQLPKILEGLGLKLDGGFTLNPLKKIENEALGGKHISKAAQLPFKYGARAAKGLGTAALVGGAAAVTGKGLRGMGTAFSGAMKGEKFGKNFSNSYSAAKAGKKRAQQMKIDGVNRGQIMGEKFKNFFGGMTAQDQLKDFQDSVKAVQSGYEQYYKGVLGSDKVAKMLEQRRIAAENRGDAEAADRLQTAIDARVKSIRSSGGKVALDIRSKADLDAFGASIEGGTAYSESSTEFANIGLTQITTDKGLNSIEATMSKTIRHIDDHYDGRFDYRKGELGVATADGKVADLKATNGKSKSVARAADNSEEARTVSNLYKYVDQKSGK